MRGCIEPSTTYSPLSFLSICTRKATTDVISSFLCISNKSQSIIRSATYSTDFGDMWRWMFVLFIEKRKKTCHDNFRYDRKSKYFYLLIQHEIIWNSKMFDRLLVMLLNRLKLIKLIYL